MSEKVPNKVLAMHDVSDLIGLNVVVASAAREIAEADGEVSYEVPGLRELTCAAAIERCLMPIRLRGAELRAIRHIAGWTAAELAGQIGEKTAVETISRWENDKQSMGAYVEKAIRVAVCEALHKEAPAVEYFANTITKLVIIDPWRVDLNYTVPAIVFGRVKLRDDERRLVDAWEPERKVA